MTDLIDAHNVGAISPLTRAMANAIAPSNVGGASLRLQDLRITGGDFASSEVQGTAAKPHRHEVACVDQN